jgi:Flp pilus assembly protein TadG
MNVEIDSHTRPMVFKRELSRAGTSRESHSLIRCVRWLASGGSEANALVEIALVMPVLLGLVTGICAFAVGFNNELTLTTAVGAGAQQLQLIRTTTTDPCADTLAAIAAAAPSLRGSNINLSITMSGTTVTGSSCSGNQSNLVAGGPVTVSATYPCSLAIYGATFSKACTLSAKVTEYEY